MAIIKFLVTYDNWDGPVSLDEGALYDSKDDAIKRIEEDIKDEEREDSSYNVYEVLAAYSYVSPKAKGVLVPKENNSCAG